MKMLMAIVILMAALVVNAEEGPTLDAYRAKYNTAKAKIQRNCQDTQTGLHGSYSKLLGNAIRESRPSRKAERR